MANSLYRPISVIIADDAEEVRTALSQLVSADDRFSLVAAAGEGDEAVSLADALRPDLVVVDVRMPGGGGIEACRRIRTVSPASCVVALSASASPSLRRRMAEAGAAAYLTKDTLGYDLLDRLVEIVTGART